MITTKDRLEQFSNTFNAAAKLGAFRNLNAEGLESTKNAMMVALDNWCNRLDMVNNFSGGKTFADPFAVMGAGIANQLAKSGQTENFSNDLGGLAATNISTLILGSYYQSYAMSYIAKLEGMPDQKTVYNIQQLRALNSFGQYQKDDIVLDPRSSVDPAGQIMGAQINEHIQSGDSVRTLVDDNSTLKTEVNFGIPIRIGTVHMFIQEKDKTEWMPVGYDRPDGYNNGNIYTRLNAAKDMKINYREGKITIDTPVALNNVKDIKFTAVYDSTKDITQSQVPTLYSGNDHIEIEAMAHQFKLQQNLEDIVKMNKIYSVHKPAGLASSYAQNTVAELMGLYIRSLDANIMKTLILPYLPHFASVKDDEAFDLSGWTTGGDVNLLEARMYELFAHLDTTMSNETERRPTCIVVDSVGAVNLMTNRFFKRQGAGLSSSDGYIGTLYDLPVIKSRTLDLYSQERYKNVNPMNIYDQLKANLGIDTSAGEAVSIGFVCHKNPGNKEAPVIVGDHIAPWCTSSMPSVGGTVVEHSILCEYGVKLMLPKLAMPLVCKVSAHPKYRAPEIKVY